MVTDTQGIESDIMNVIFSWEEKVSETAFVPHELRHVPVKKGTATVNVKFDKIKQIEVKPNPDSAPLHWSSRWETGKTREFALAITGSFRGDPTLAKLISLRTGSNVLL